MPLFRPKTALSACLLAAIMALAGCAAQPPGPQTPAQRLKTAEATFTEARIAVNVLIATGYLAKGDAKLQKAILMLENEISDAFAEADSYLTNGPPNMVNVEFWLDKGLAWLETYLTYEAAGEVKHKLSNPTTRPALKRGLFR